jgi:high affinity sulfate transporter 1
LTATSPEPKKRNLLEGLMPFSSLRGYRMAWLTPDLVAGITLLVIAVPEQLATSRLAGMPPITGFFAFAAGGAMFALLGSNPQMSVGADSTIAPLFAVGVAHLAASGTTEYIDLVGILAVMVGALVAIIGLLRLGWIAEFLSDPIIAGFMGGVAVIIVVHQLPDFFGLPSVSGTTVHRVATVLSHLGQSNGWTLGIGVVVLAVVVAAERIDRKLPGALFGLIGSTVLVGVLKLQTHGVNVLGTVAHGAPHLGLTGLSWSTLGSVAPVAGVVALVVVSQTAATTRAFATQGHYDVDVGRDFVGVGVGSMVSGLVGAFPVNASPARTAAVASAGGRTQVAGLGAVAAIICVVPAAGLLKDVPLATLAAVLVYVATRVLHGKELLAIARFDRFEFGLALITLLTVALVGVEQGIGVAVGLAILDRTRLTARSKMQILGRIPNSTSWTPLSADPDARPVPSVLVVLFSSPLWYANAVHFQGQLRTAVSSAPAPLKVVVLDSIGMNDSDFTGCRVLQEELDDLAAAHIEFGVARAGAELMATMHHSGLFDRIGARRFYDSVNEAVVGLTTTAAAPPDAPPAPATPATPATPAAPPAPAAPDSPDPPPPSSS